MSDLVSTSPIHLPEEDAEILDEVLIASSPDSWSFQHHLDRVTHIVTQGAHLLDLTSAKAPFVFTGKSGTNFVRALWERLGFEEKHVLHRGNPTAIARHLIFSCRAVLVHPFLSLGALQRFGIDHYQPSSTRNKIVYMSRSNGRASNGGRKVLNEEELLEGIQSLLNERKLGEELVLFDEDAFPDLDSLFSWFGANVAAIVGPHGGALLHHRWAAKGALIIEFMPTTFTSLAIYEEASVLSQQYAVLVVDPSVEGGKDMVIDVEDVTRLLTEHLGKGETAEDPLRKYYPWKAKELGLDSSD
ncbi:hypothetical protein BCR35DRAFT_334489 [Leucosporidium creatinivorum]|uniref:Glycosyltransferase 61 catalytic domain-containing protein n=1 Tax=Leucosporidium creatinivorum TaxID=106004 RepID=A0A1Y2E5V5_9BASI|nr:hypothetical protein BCR35DRAFT_334489 [Leucosporidium creatinivorum]